MEVWKSGRHLSSRQQRRFESQDDICLVGNNEDLKVRRGGHLSSGNNEGLRPNYESFFELTAVSSLPLS